MSDISQIGRRSQHLMTEHNNFIKLNVSPNPKSRDQISIPFSAPPSQRPTLLCPQIQRQHQTARQWTITRDTNREIELIRRRSRCNPRGHLMRTL